MSDSIVIIPTYNEKENIEKIIRAVFGLESSLISSLSMTEVLMVLLPLLRA